MPKLRCLLLNLGSLLAELRLARLYGVNTTAPLVQTRTKTEVEPPVRAIDLPPPSPTTTAMNKSFFTMVNPDPWKPAGPALKLLVRFLCTT